MITREQVADLQPGDVVELGGHPMLHRATLRGPLRESGDGELSVGDYVVRYRDGRPNLSYADRMHLAVVSRAPRPLYVNHDRTEAVAGDVIDYPDQHLNGIGPWYAHRPHDDDREPIRWMSPSGPVIGDMPSPMRLLVDGETGQVVP